MILTHVAFTRRGVKHFEKEVNAVLKTGLHELVSVEVTKKGLRFVCLAVFEKIA